MSLEIITACYMGQQNKIFKCIRRDTKRFFKLYIFKSIFRHIITPARYVSINSVFKDVLRGTKVQILLEYYFKSILRVCKKC